MSVQSLCTPASHPSGLVTERSALSRSNGSALSLQTHNDRLDGRSHVDDSTSRGEASKGAEGDSSLDEDHACLLVRDGEKLGKER